MTEPRDLATALKALAAEPGSSLATALTPDDVLAWVEGRLEREEAEWVEAEVRKSPELTALADDMRMFLAGEPLPEASPLPATAAIEKLAPVVALESRKPSAERSFTRWQQLAAAAGFAAALLGAGLWGTLGRLRELEASKPNSVSVLTPLEEARGEQEAPGFILPANRAAHPLLFLLASRPPFEVLRLEARPANQPEGAVLWSVDSLRIETGDMVSANLGRGDLPPGEYLLVLIGQEGAATKEVARYRLNLSPEK